MSKRVIAFAARVTPLSVDDESTRRKKISEQNAFLNRAQQATKEAFQFSTGWDIINTLVYDQGNAVNDIRIHDHGFPGGIIGDGSDIGMYVESYHNSRGSSGQLYNQATAGNFGYQVSLGKIRLADNCSIIIYGCNCSSFAQELSMFLGKVERNDVSVTGADNNVYEKGGRAHVDKNEHGVSGKTPGKFRTYKGGTEISSSATWSYQ